MRVKELRSSWWTRARRHRNKLCKSGHGTSRSSSRVGGEDKSWKGVVEAAAEARLNNLGPFQAPYVPQGGWKSDNLVASHYCGGQSQELMGELKSLLGHRKVLSHSMLLLVRCAEFIWLIR